MPRLYQEAKQHYTQGDVAGALTRLDAITSAPDLSPEEHAFYERQRQICQDALAGRQTADATAPLPFTPSTDCGPRALLLVCRQQGIANPPTLARLCRVAGMNPEGVSLAGLGKAAQAAGLDASGVQMDKAALASLSGPAIAWVDGSHYVAVLDVRTSLTGDTSATVHDPNERAAKQMSIDELLRRSGGVLLVLNPTKKG